MWYWCEATSLEGFVQQLAVCYVGRGYHFYVTGRVPPDKDAREIDRKLPLKYGVIMPKWTRSRRKKPRAGPDGRGTRRAVMQYIRHGDFFVLLATEGGHRFFQEEAGIKDIRAVPIGYAGYSISLRAGRVHVRIAEQAYKDLRAYVLNIAVHRSVPKLIAGFYSVPFEPYGPVKAQLLSLLGEVERPPPPGRVRQGAEVGRLAQAAVRQRVRPTGRRHVDAQAGGERVTGRGVGFRPRRGEPRGGTHPFFQTFCGGRAVFRAFPA